MFILGAPLILPLRVNNTHLVLPHLYDTIPGYLESYKVLSRQGDFLMQDNSLFELKEVVAGDLIEFAFRIGAAEVVIPEVLRDYKGSIEKAKAFFDSGGFKQHRTTFKWAAVVQGRDLHDIKTHYMWLSSRSEISTICIPFNFEFDAYGESDEEKKQSGWNRYSIIRALIRDKVWNNTKEHHLLGLYNPAELAQYANLLLPNNIPEYSSIRSNDSSSCFWHSLHGVSFDANEGLLYRKIETHVDFNASFFCNMHYRLFRRNSAILKRFALGKGILYSTKIWNTYCKWCLAVEEDIWI